MNLVHENDSILTTPAILISFVKPQVDLIELEKHMVKLVQENRALGIAAPQIGVPYSIFYINELKELMINPEILAHSDAKTKMKEGCLSFPYLYVLVERWIDITVKYYDKLGNEHIKELTGSLARCFQHELDHLHGITITNRTSKLSLDIAKRKRIKWFKKGDI